MTFRRGFKTQANSIAVGMRADLGLEPTSPLDPWAVCNHLEIFVLKLSELTDADNRQVGRHFLHAGREAFSAVVVPRGIRTAIVYNDSHAPVRQRSNIFHELSHLFLRHPIRPLLAADGSRDRDGAVEDEAAFLSGCLLITNEAAHHILSSGISSIATTVYQVSEVMLNYRLGVSGANQVAARRASKRLAG